MKTTFTTLVTNETRMVLQPEILNIREDWRNSLNRRVNNNISKLPYIEEIDRISTIDSNGIIEINNSTTSKRRIE